MVEIKTIFFDLFGVLLGTDQSTIIHHVATQTNTSFLQAKDIVMGEIFMRLQRGEIGFNQYFQNLQYTIPNGKNLNYESFKIKWLNNQIDELPAVCLLDRLKNKYEINIISNTTEAHIEHLKVQFNFLTTFDHVITSEAANSRKPQTDIFIYALNKVGTTPQYSIFIDDMKGNIQAASNLDFTTHHYINYEEFESFINPYL